MDFVEHRPVPIDVTVMHATQRQQLRCGRYRNCHQSSSELKKHAKQGCTCRLQTNPALACREVQQVVSCLAGDHGAHQISSTASKCKENMGEADSQTTK